MYNILIIVFIRLAAVSHLYAKLTDASLNLDASHLNRRLRND